MGPENKQNYFQFNFILTWLAYMYMYITINKKKSTCMTVKGQLRIYFGRWGSILRWRGTQIWSKPRAEGTHICSKPEEVTFLLKFSKNSMYLIYLCTNKLKTRLINTTNTPPVRENQKTLYIMHIMHYKYIEIFKFYGGGVGHGVPRFGWQKIWKFPHPVRISKQFLKLPKSTDCFFSRHIFAKFS